MRGATARSESLLFVVDDVHLIHDPTVHRALEFLLDHMPPTTHFVLAGREAPPLSLGRRRARHELLELHAADLKFDTEEANEFFRTRMGFALPEPEVDSLNNQVEGWVTGLQLVALTLRSRSPATGAVVVSGQHRHIADYLGDEVIAQLPSETRSFLLETSLLDTFCESLCAAVTGNPQSGAMLESLERANLFLQPLDDRRAWFRYHRVFADFLRQHLEQRFPDKVNELHARAARWYLDHDLPDHAFRHAMEAKDVGIVSTVLDRYLPVKMFSGEMALARTWVDSIPEDWITEHPNLVLARVAVLLTSGQDALGSSLLDEVDQLTNADHTRFELTRAKATAMRCFIACFHHDVTAAEDWAAQAFRSLPAHDFAGRAHLFHALGDSHRSAGHWAESRTNYLKVLDLARAHPTDPNCRLLSVHVYAALADLELQRGRLRDAASYWRRALDAIRQPEHWGHFPLPLTGWIHLRMGEISYEINDLAQARARAEEGLRHAELGGDTRSIIAGKIIQARLDLTEGSLERAKTRLDEANLLLDGASFPEWEGRFQRFQVELWIAGNEQHQAMAWCEHRFALAIPATEDPASHWLPIARVLVHRGDPASLARAADLLDQVIVVAEARDQQALTIEALALRAILHDLRGDPVGMMADLERSLRMAEPEGYTRLFVDLGRPMAKVLQQARHRGVMPAYVEHLLSAGGAIPEAGTLRNAYLVEPLSDRELEVLKLLALGLSNREIAGQLFVSPETIKKHAGNIYGKLGVHGRVEAITRARMLSLIE